MVMSRVLSFFFIGIALFSCESLKRIPAIDARASIGSLDDAKALIPFMDQGHIEKMLLSSSDAEAAIVAAYPDRFISVASIAGLAMLEEQPKFDLSLVTAAFQQYPDRAVICPSFCSLVAKPEQLEKLLNRFPRLYVDIGFAGRETLEHGLLKISKNAAPMRQLLLAHPNRFLFATALDVNAKNRHDEIEILGAFKGYRRLLEKAHYHFPKLSRLWEKRGLRLQTDGALHGLFLPKEVLEKIYRENIVRLMH